MSLIRKHNLCRGIRLWKWGTFQIELWFCPRGTEIQPHRHEHIDSTIIVLKGRMFGGIGDRWGRTKRFKLYQVPKGVTHHAVMSDLGSIIFMNIERWDGPPTSAAEDFTAA